MDADRPGARVRAWRSRPMAVDVPGARAVPARARPDGARCTRSWSWSGRRPHASGACATCRCRWRARSTRGGQPSVQAALVKEMGTRFEQDLLETLRRLVERRAGTGLAVVVRAAARQRDPHRAGVHHPRRHDRDPALGRGEGVARMTTVDPLLSETAARVFADTATFAAVEQAEADGWAPTIWDAVAETGLAWVSVAEAAGGAGGSARRCDRGAAHRRASRGAAPARRDRHARRLAARRGRPRDPRRPVTRRAGHRGRRPRAARRRAARHRAPRALGAGRRRDRRAARHRRRSGGGRRSIRPTCASSPRSNLAGEPRETRSCFDGVTPRAIAPAGSRCRRATRSAGAARSPAPRRWRARWSAWKRSRSSTPQTRRQFGKPVGTLPGGAGAPRARARSSRSSCSVALAAAVRAADRGDGAVRDHRGQAARRPGRERGDPPRPPGPRGDGHDAGVPAPPPVRGGCGPGAASTATSAPRAGPWARRSSGSVPTGSTR